MRWRSVALSTVRLCRRLEAGARSYEVPSSFYVARLEMSDIQLLYFVVTYKKMSMRWVVSIISSLEALSIWGDGALRTTLKVGTLYLRVSITLRLHPVNCSLTVQQSTNIVHTFANPAD
ncbi:uncharacterized protein [Physcomitrium patens]|uniref:uncharacterized protein n=1 Tax=Physcomitrium patens TaxID=3218 RepID=UPI003CCE39F9